MRQMTLDWLALARVRQLPPFDESSNENKLVNSTEAESRFSFQPKPGTRLAASNVAFLVVQSDASKFSRSL